MGNGFEEAIGVVCAELSDGFVSIMAAFLDPEVVKDQQIVFTKSPVNPLTV